MKYLFFTSFLFILTVQQMHAGPPYYTDDPEPVELHHWEYYISSLNTLRRNNLSTGTSPHFEVNYGLISNVQLHLILPLNYNYSSQYGFNFGYAYTEIGLKYRFIQETENAPQIGTFPIVEIPTIRNSQFGNGKIQLFIPVWVQKSWGKLTSYGGVGYWINPGIDTKNWFFSGWEIQYDFLPVITLGGELYFHTTDSIGNSSTFAFNLGGSFNASKKFHALFSIGHSLINESYTTTYLGLLWTI